MKKKMPLSIKLKFLVYWLTEHKGTATLVTCGRCNSTKVTFMDGKQEGNVYTSNYVCKDCGATATCVETWDI